MPLHDGYALALEEARRALEEQERSLAQLCARAGTLVSAAAIATSFLGGPAITRGEVGAAAWIAIAAFVGLAVTTLSILWPRQEWEFSVGPTLIVEGYLEPVMQTPVTGHALHRELALYMGASAIRNRTQLDRIERSLHISIVLLTVEMLSWVVVIALDA